RQGGVVEPQLERPAAAILRERPARVHRRDVATAGVLDRDRRDPERVTTIEPDRSVALELRRQTRRPELPAPEAPALPPHDCLEELGAVRANDDRFLPERRRPRRAVREPRPGRARSGGADDPRAAVVSNGV